MFEYNSDGTLNTGFNSTGKKTIDFSGATDKAYAMAIQSDGKILVAGSSGSDFAIARLNSSASSEIVDSTFNSGNEVMVNFGCGVNAAAYAVAVQSDGTIYLAGTAVTPCCTSSFAVSRLTSSGSLDTTFDADGKLTTTFNVYSTTDQINAAAITASGSFLAAGQFAPCAPCQTTNDFALARYCAPSGLEERLYAIHDANENITAVTSVYGNVLERYEYDPYGQRTILSPSYSSRSSSTYAFTYGFQGLQHNTVSNWIYARNRWLIPSLQTWNRMDPLGYPDGANAYECVRSNPTAGSDPLGLCDKINFGSEHDYIATGSPGVGDILNSGYAKIGNGWAHGPAAYKVTGVDREYDNPLPVRIWDSIWGDPDSQNVHYTLTVEPIADAPTSSSYDLDLNHLDDDKLQLYAGLSESNLYDAIEQSINQNKDFEVWQFGVPAGTMTLGGVLGMAEEASDLPPCGTSSSQPPSAAIEGVNPGTTAVLKNGYYEVNGVKFSEYYYNKLWSTGRGAPSLVAREVLEGTGGKGVADALKSGFYRYEYGGWEMIYNPTTKEVWHLQPIK